MLSKIARLCGMSLAGMAFAHTGMAQDANVTTGAQSAKLGGEFRAELNYDNHGFEKVKGGDTPKATTAIQLQRAALTMHGNVNKDTEYALRFNLLNPDLAGGESPVDYGYGTHWFTKQMGFSIGKMKVAQGGWDTWNGGYKDPTYGLPVAYSMNLPFKEYEDMIEMQMKVAGTIRLQLLNDMTKAQGAEWNMSQHPTYVIGWQGEFGPIKPLVDLGSYDNNKSRWIDLGVGTEMSGLSASLDIFMLNHVHKYPDPSDAEKNKEIADAGTGITLNAAYELKGTATPFLYFSTWDNKQGADSDLNLEDHKYNADPATAGAAPNWDDNGQTFSVGSYLDFMGKNFNPYVALVNTSGKFNDGSAKEETKSNMWLRIGVVGSI